MVRTIAATAPPDGPKDDPVLETSGRQPLEREIGSDAPTQRMGWVLVLQTCFLQLKAKPLRSTWSSRLQFTTKVRSQRRKRVRGDHAWSDGNIDRALGSVIVFLPVSDGSAELTRGESLWADAQLLLLVMARVPQLLAHRHTERDRDRTVALWDRSQGGSAEGKSEREPGLVLQRRTEEGERFPRLPTPSGRRGDGGWCVSYLDILWVVPTRIIINIIKFIIIIIISPFAQIEQIEQRFRKRGEDGMCALTTGKMCPAIMGEQQVCLPYQQHVLIWSFYAESSNKTR